MPMNWRLMNWGSKNWKPTINGAQLTLWCTEGVMYGRCNVPTTLTHSNGGGHRTPHRLQDEFQPDAMTAVVFGAVPYDGFADEGCFGLVDRNRQRHADAQLIIA